MEALDLSDIPDDNYPTTNIVQGGGPARCPPLEQTGTLCVRVRRQDRPETQYLFLTAYHIFERQGDPWDFHREFQWRYKKDGRVTDGLTGMEILKEYRWGPGRAHPFLDQVVIALDSTSTGAKRSDLFQGPGVAPQKVLGTTAVAQGTRVRKFGMATATTHGVVVARPRDWDAVYDPYVFFVQRTNEAGQPIAGKFSQAGDSGAPVLANVGYVAGMIIQDVTDPDTGAALAVVSRIEQIERTLDVKVFTSGG